MATVESGVLAELEGFGGELLRSGDPGHEGTRGGSTTD